MVDRLAEDHANARVLAQGLASIPGILIDPNSVETNLVFFSLSGFDQAAFQACLREKGVLSTGYPGRVRLVTHYGIERNDIDEALGRVKEVVASLA